MNNNENYKKESEVMPIMNNFDKVKLTMLELFS